MARYIEESEVIKVLTEYYHQRTETQRKALEDALSRVPDADVRENVHGCWVEMGENEDGTHNICCGACGKGKLKSRGHANSIYTYRKYKFCIECGAKMKGTLTLMNFTKS